MSGVFLWLPDRQSLPLYQRFKLEQAKPTRRKISAD